MVATCLSLHTPSFIVIYLYGRERVCAYMCECGLPSWCGHVDACFQMLHRPDIVEIICWKLILSTLSPAEERVGTSAPNIRSLVCRYSNSKKPSITATAFARVSARRRFSDNKTAKCIQCTLNQMCSSVKNGLKQQDLSCMGEIPKKGLRVWEKQTNMWCLYCILYSLYRDGLFFELCEMVVLRVDCLFKSQSLGRLACWVGRWNLVCFYKQAFLSTKRVSLAGWSWGCAYTRDWILKSCLIFFYDTS